MFTALNILALGKFSTMNIIYKDIIMIDNNINGGMIVALKPKKHVSKGGRIFGRTD